jgi:two-component system sensor kinase FixL
MANGSRSLDEATRRSLWLTATEHVRDVIIVMDAQTGELVDANHAAELAYGYTVAELRTLTVFDLRVDPPQPVSQQMVAADADGILFEALHKRKDGTPFPVEVSSRGETINNHRYLLSIIRDITDRRAADQERERLLIATQQALAAREEFLWVASHELRTPITIANLQLHQVRRMLARNDADRRDAALDATIGQLARLDALVRRLLDASQVDGIDIQYADIDLADVAREASERLRAQAGEMGSMLTVNVPPLRGRWDPLRLEQVVMNLVANAIKYGDGKPVEVTGTADNGMVHLDVTDHGIGLAPADLERIFDKFIRAVPAAHYGGLGLGLYIARQIVEAHCGWIEAMSTLGAGSTFRVTLPRSRPG